MANIHNSLGSLYGGVSQQPVVDRSLMQVEEMINCIPTIDTGLIPRNPMTNLGIESTTFDTDTYSYEYDRGYAAIGSKERYSLQVNKDGAKVINLSSGKVYSEGNGALTFGSPTAKTYLTNFSDINGYSGTTIKDTTFIVNKTITPKLYTNEDDPSGDITEDRDFVIMNFVSATPTWSGNTLWGTSGKAPYVHEDFALSPRQLPVRYSIGVSTVVNIMAQEINYTPPTYKSTTGVPGSVSFNGYLDILVDKIQTAMGINYRVDRNGSDITIQSLSVNSPILDTDVSVSFSKTTYDGYSSTTFFYDYNNFYSGTTGGTEVVNLTEEELSYREFGYIWIQKSEPVSGYKYTCVITVLELSTGDELALTSKTSAGKLNTEDVAVDLASLLDDLPEVTVESRGSIVRINAMSGYQILDVDMSDTFGNQAASGWGRAVSSIEDLPNNFPYLGAITKVVGFDTDENNDYWVKKIEDIWTEWYNPEDDRLIDNSTMPHVLVRNEDDTFIFKEFDGWSQMLVGDHNTNSVPSFLYSEEVPDAKIKDIFFFKNRLGFITDTSIVMSEVNNYGNFWRSSVVTLLDKDRIDGVVDTTKAIRLQYATTLEDILVLFSDTAQFVVKGTNVLSPNTIQVSQASAYDVNVAVRPIFMNNEIYFCAKRGDYTQVMKYRLSEQAGKNVIGEDVTIQVPRYISSDLSSFSFSPINNMLFITTNDELDTVYVYKTVKVGNDIIQTAWFKWVFQADIYKVFAFEDTLYLMSATFDNPDSPDWILQDGTWDDNGIWYDDDLWRDSHEDIGKTSVMQNMRIFNNLNTPNGYLDNGTTPFSQEVNIGEWIYADGTVKEPRGHLLCKTAQIESSDDSSFELIIDDINRGSSRTVKSKHTINRKPMIYGNAENIRLSIKNDFEDGTGFVLQDLSLEGNFNLRSRRR